MTSDARTAAAAHDLAETPLDLSLLDELELGPRVAEWLARTA